MYFLFKGHINMKYFKFYYCITSSNWPTNEKLFVLMSFQIFNIIKMLIVKLYAECISNKKKTLPQSLYCLYCFSWQSKIIFCDDRIEEWHCARLVRNAVVPVKVEVRKWVNDAFQWSGTSKILLQICFEWVKQSNRIE